MPNKIRILLVKHLVLYTRITLFGKTIGTLRAPRVLFPLTVAVAIVVVGNPYTYDLYWYSYLALGVLAFGYWLGLGNFRFTYFGIWPAQFDELVDLEQKYDFLRGVNSMKIKNPFEGDGTKYAPLSSGRRLQLYNLEYILKQDRGRFYNLKSLLPPILSVIAITIWYLVNLS